MTNIHTHMPSIKLVQVVALLLWCAYVYGAGAGPPLTPCLAVKLNEPLEVQVRGTAEITPQGVLLADSSCPIIVSKTDKMPSAVLAQITSYASDDLRDRFSRLKQLKLFPLFTATVRGTIECKNKLEWKISDDGTIMQADGFGPHGLVKCRMIRARLEAFEETIH